MGRGTHGSPTLESGVLNRKQIMERFGWSPSFLWKAMTKKGLPFRKVGTIPYFIVAEVNAWLAQLPGQKLGSR